MSNKNISEPKNNNQAKKKLRFNYFVPHLVDVQHPDNDIRWDMREFSEFILGHNHSDLNTAVPLGDEIADLEWDTMRYDSKQDRDIYYFQLSKNRSKDIPSKKKLNHDKSAIELEDDEYIGEFNLIIYDAKYNIVIIQSNYYGLSTHQIETTLSILRQRIKDIRDESEDDNPKGIVLEPLIDNSEIDNVKKYKIYRRITVKGSDYNFAASESYKDNPLNKAINDLKKIGGVNFTIELSMSRESKSKSLEKKDVREIINEVLEVRKNTDSDVSMNIASKKEEDASMEFVNLLEPRLTSTIVMYVKNRTTIASESIYIKFCEENYLSERSNGKDNMRDKAKKLSGIISES